MSSRRKPRIVQFNRVATRNRHSLSSRLREDLPYFANLLFYAVAALLIIQGSLPWVVTVAVLVLKWAWQILAFAQPARRFEGGLVFLAAPLMEIYFTVANTILILTPLPSNRKFKK